MKPRAETSSMALVAVNNSICLPRKSTRNTYNTKNKEKKVAVHSPKRSRRSAPTKSTIKVPLKVAEEIEIIDVLETTEKLTIAPSSSNANQTRRPQVSQAQPREHVFGPEATFQVQNFIKRLDFLDQQFQTRLGSELIQEIWENPNSPKLTEIINQILNEYGFLPPVHKVMPIVLFDSSCRPIFNFLFFSKQITMELEELFKLAKESQLIAKTLYSLVFGRYQQIGVGNNASIN